MIKIRLVFVLVYMSLCYLFPGEKSVDSSIKLGDESKFVGKIYTSKEDRIKCDPCDKKNFNCYQKSYGFRVMGIISSLSGFSHNLSNRYVSLHRDN